MVIFTVMPPKKKLGIKKNVTGNFFLSVESLNGEFSFSILQHLPLIYPIFTYVDPNPQSC